MLKLFVLYRIEDETGISGTGVVAEGIEFSDGKCVISWVTEHKSIAIYENIEQVIMIHGHNGKTVIRFLHSTEYAKEFPID